MMEILIFYSPLKDDDLTIDIEIYFAIRRYDIMSSARRFVVLLD